MKSSFFKKGLRSILVIYIEIEPNLIVQITKCCAKLPCLVITELSSISHASGSMCPKHWTGRRMVQSQVPKMIAISAHIPGPSRLARVIMPQSTHSAWNEYFSILLSLTCCLPCRRLWLVLMPRSKRPDDRKPKKRAPIRTTRSESDQQNIPHLFKASQEADTVDGPSPSKRPKLDHSALQEGTGLPNAIKLGQMYNFQKPNQIDLINGDGPAKTITVSRKHNGIIRPSNTSSQTGPKRLEVKNARLNSKTDPDEYFNQVWVKLDATLSAIMANEKIAYPLEELYKGVEILCRQGRAPLLFKHLGEKCKQGLISLYERPLMELASRVGCSDVEILRAVVESWSRWNAQTVSPIRLAKPYTYLI